VEVDPIEEYLKAVFRPKTYFCFRCGKKIAWGRFCSRKHELESESVLRAIPKEIVS